MSGERGPVDAYGWPQDIDEEKEEAPKSLLALNLERSVRR